MSSVKYYCPYCTQTSSRKWNLEVHLQRRHQGMGEPVGSGQVKFAYDWRPHYKADPRKERPKMASHYSRRFDGAIFSYNDEMTTYKGGKRDYLGDILETLHKVTEIKRLTKELSPQYQQPLSWFTPAMNHVPVNYSEGFFEKLESTTFTPNTDPLRDYIVGLTCHVCTMSINCTLTFIRFQGLRKNSYIVPRVQSLESSQLTETQCAIQMLSPEETICIINPNHEESYSGMVARRE